MIEEKNISVLRKQIVEALAPIKNHPSSIEVLTALGQVYGMMLGTAHALGLEASTIKSLEVVVNEQAIRSFDLTSKAMGARR